MTYLKALDDVEQFLDKLDKLIDSLDAIEPECEDHGDRWAVKMMRTHLYDLRRQYQCRECDANPLKSGE